MGKKRKVPAINGASCADIAFMLLLFFLLTTSMDTDQGLARKLPPPPEKNMLTDVKVRERNILKIMINTNNQILCGGDYIDIRQLKDRAKAFILNESNNEHMPEKVTEDVPYFGEMTFTKFHVISLQNDRGTLYQAYIDVQNELAAAYNELRNDVTMKKWGKRFDDLNEDQQEAVKIILKQNISEAEPKSYGDRK
jgi:biopolymer transport protein ExbD